MNDYFSMDFFSQICLSGTVLSTVVYQVISVRTSFLTLSLCLMSQTFLQMSPSTDPVLFSYNMTFMITISTQAFLNSYFGQAISTASNELSNAAYSSKWYSMSTGDRKDLLILMERLKVKSELKAGKLFTMDLTLFGTVNLGHNSMRYELSFWWLNRFRLWTLLTACIRFYGESNFEQIPSITRNFSNFWHISWCLIYKIHRFWSASMRHCSLRLIIDINKKITEWYLKA